MEFTEEEKKLQEETCIYIQERKDELIDQFVIRKNPLKLGFITIFMAGSPGAGKTEFSQRYIPIIFDKKDPKMIKVFDERGINLRDVDTLFVRIDVDEIREFLPQYKKTDRATGVKGNAHIIQKAANKGLDILRNYCLKNEISFLHDGTFGNYDTMKEIIRKSLNAGRTIQIYYLYLDPIAAWEFTKAREFIEGRNIIKDKFIEQYFNSRENVNKIKAEFGDKVRINCVLKDSNNKVQDIALNVPDIDQYLKTKYNRGLIQLYSKEDLLNKIP